MQIMNEAIEKKIEEFKERYRELNDNGSVDFRVTVGMWREAIDFGASLERTEMRKMLKGMDKDNTGYIRNHVLKMLKNTTGAFNYLYIDDLIEYLKTIEWEEPDDVQLIICGQDNNKFSIWNLSDNNLLNVQGEKALSEPKKK
jgi:hypothetical protein